VSSPGELHATDDPPPLRILVGAPKFAPQIGGAETWLRALLAAMVDRGHHVDVVSRAAPELSDRSSINGISVHRTPGGRVAFARAIDAAVRSLHPDAVIAHYSALAPSVWSARRAGIPSVGIVHDVYGWRESLRIKGPVVGTLRHVGLERSLRWLRPDAFLVNSRATAERLRPLAGGRDITVIPAGADHLPARADEGDVVGGTESDVLYVGRLVHQKGAADLVAAVRLLREGGTAVRAVIVGTGPQEAELRRVAAGLDGAVTMAGRLHDAELDTAIRGTSLLVLPSTREGWGLAVTEAAARGVPYVAYDIPAVREQHEVLQGGVLVPPDLRSLGAAIRDLLADAGRRAALGERGRANAATLRWADAARAAERAVARALRTSTRNARASNGAH
jgi:glycosyltransferase involved in cell wall biosynthesis